MNDDMNDEAKVQEDLVESTFFLKDLGTLEEISQEIGPQITDFLPIAFVDTDDFF